MKWNTIKCKILQQIFRNFQYILPWRPNLPNSSKITKFMEAFLVLGIYVEILTQLSFYEFCSGNQVQFCCTIENKVRIEKFYPSGPFFLFLQSKRFDCKSQCTWREFVFIIKPVVFCIMYFPWVIFLHSLADLSPILQVNKDWCTLIQTKCSSVSILRLVRINVHKSLVTLITTYIP